MVGVKCLDEVVVDTSGCRGVAVIWGCCIVALRCWGGDVCDVFGAIFYCALHCSGREVFRGVAVVTLRCCVGGVFGGAFIVTLRCGGGEVIG